MKLILSLLVASAVFLPQVDEPAPPPTSKSAQDAGAPAKRSLDTLSALQKNREAKTQALRELRDKLALEQDPEQRTVLSLQVRSLQQELEQLQLDYESVATGIDARAFDLTSEDAFDLQHEIQKLLEPIIEELKAATEEPRQIERLRGQIEVLGKREQLAREAVKGIEALLAGLEQDDPTGLAIGLEQTRKAWEQRAEEVAAQRTVTQFQLEKRLSQRTSILESTKGAFATFFRSRGLNLLLAVVALGVVYFGLRGLLRPFARIFLRKRKEGRPFYARLVEVLAMLLIGAMAIGAALLVFYAAGDWVLLALALLFLLGVAWASKTAVPRFLEQIRLLLDLGTVRERERVLIDGEPYRVLRVSFYTLLPNPELAGGVRRLPIGDLIEMRSRTCSRDEVWFPCKRGEWVLLSDGTRGEVKHQSPDFVQLEMLGGARVSYPTSSFLQLAPRNLSAGFRVQVRFGIDYAHQGISTTDVPVKLAARIRTAIEQRHGPEGLAALKVEFLEAGASSLDYLVLADLSGEVAPQYERVQRLIQSTCVDACNDEGWVIPFTQITVHQAQAG